MAEPRKRIGLSGRLCSSRQEVGELKEEKNSSIEEQGLLKSGWRTVEIS
jgi:hypothetical protein